MEKGKETVGTPDYICTGKGEKTPYKELYPDVLTEKEGEEKPEESEE